MKRNGATKKLDSNNAEQVDEISTVILKTLGIKISIAKATKARKILDSKLRSAIVNDLIAVDNEQAETMERMAGYWRYANRRTYNQMVENNLLWDWATGAKLQKVEEESDLEVIDEEEESLEGGTSEESISEFTPLTSPESGLDDFYEPAVSDVPLFSRTTEGEDDIRTPTQANHSRHILDPETLVDTIRSGCRKLHLSDLKYSLGRSPGPTHRFTVPSPSSSDDESYEEDWDFIDEDGHIISEVGSTWTAPLSPATPTAKGSIFDGEKDTRAHNKAVYIREASPPQITPAELSPWGKAPSPTTIPPGSADVNNHFGNLDRELPAPCDDPKVVDTSLKVKMITLAMPSKKPLPVAEEGWEIKGANGAPRRKRDFPPLNKAKKPTHTAPRIPAAPKKKMTGPSPIQKTAGIDASWANVAAGQQKKK